VYTTQSVCIVPSWYEPSWKVPWTLCSYYFLFHFLL
jgi:hypothetical protein